jgi:hypothetical protein
MLNVSFRRVGGLHFLRVGRLQISWCVCRDYRDINAPNPHNVLPEPQPARFRTSVDGQLVLGFIDEAAM